MNNKKKNIIFVTSFFVTNGNSGGAARLRNYAKALVLCEDVNVIICSLVSGYKIDFNNKNKVEKGIFEISQKKYKPSNNKIISFIKYKFPFFTFLSFFIKINKFIIYNKRANNVIYLYPEQRGSFELMSVLYFKIIRKHKLYYEANEVRKYAIENSVYNKNNIILRFFKALNAISYNLAESCIKYYDGVIAISTNMVKYHKVNNSNIIRIPILSDLSSINTIRNTPVYNPNEYFNICFTGSINYKKEGFNVLYKVLSNLVKKNKINLHLYGVFDGGEKALEKLSEKLKISGNIFYHGSVSSKILISEMQKYHLLILPRPNTPQIKYGFSTKLSEYIISGVPVLVTDVSDNSLYIIDGVNGFIVPPNNAFLMEKKIVSIINEYNNKTDLIVKNAYKLAEQNFNYKNYTKELNDFLC